VDNSSIADSIYAFILNCLNLRVSNLTILKKSPQEFNVCGIIANALEGYHPVPYIFGKILHDQHLLRR